MEGRPLARWFDRKGWSDLLIGAPYVWLLAFCLLPFLIATTMRNGSRKNASSHT